MLVTMPPVKGKREAVRVDIGVYQGVTGRQVEVLSADTTRSGSILEVRDLDTGEVLVWVEVEEQGALRHLL